MGKNINSENSGKKHGKFATWFLNLPKWGKILLIGGATVGVSSAVVFPVLGATVWAQEKYVTITKEEAYNYCKNNFCYKTTDVEDVASLIKGGSFNWDMTEYYRDQVFTYFIADLLPYTSLKGTEVANIPIVGNLSITDINGYRNELPNSSVTDFVYKSVDSIGEFDKFSEGLEDCCRLYGEDIYLALKQEDVGFSASYTFRYSKQGVVKVATFDLEVGTEKMSGKVVHNL